MKTSIKLGLSAFIATALLSGCSNSKVNESKSDFSFAGHFDIVPDGTCDIKSYKDRVIRLDITKVKETGQYKAEIPTFKDSSVPHVSSLSHSKDNQLSLYFEDKTQDENAEVNVTLELEPFAGQESSVRVTKFAIYKNIDDKEETRDFVQWYISKIPKANVEKDKITGLCAVDTVAKKQAAEANSAD